MPNPTPLEIAAALRSTADFCRDPNSPKATSCNRAEDAYGDRVSPLGNGAVKWCAIGWIEMLLALSDDSNPYVVVGQRGLAWTIAGCFDAGDYEEAAILAENRATEIEAPLPSTRPAIRHAETVPA